MQGLQVVQPGLELVDQTEKANHFLGAFSLEADTQAVREQDQGLPRRNPFRLSPLAFGGLVGLITALVVGGSVAAGLGVMLGQCRGVALQ